MASKQALAHLEQVRKYQAELVGSTNVAPTLEEKRLGSEANLETKENVSILCARADDKYIHVENF